MAHGFLRAPRGKELESDPLKGSNQGLWLQSTLPKGCVGLIAMICYWHYTLFYLAAELWSLLILSILFWGFLNETCSLEESKRFYPLCMFTGNFAGILSGQVSHFLCHNRFFTWQETLQGIIALVALCGIAIMLLHRAVDGQNPVQPLPSKAPKMSFLENVRTIFASTPLLCITLLVIGFGLTNNLIEVIWKESIRTLYPDPQSYNAYINQLTSIIGASAVVMALISRWIYQRYSWTTVALITPTTLFLTSLLFFTALLMPSETLHNISLSFAITPALLIVTLGSIHYVLSLTAKFTLFDTSKEMAFFATPPEERIKAKSVIDSVGSRLGKSGSSCLYQFLLISFGSTSGQLPLIAITSLSMIAISLLATKRLGQDLSQKVVAVTE